MNGSVREFAPFRLDLPNACLWNQTTRLSLMPKDFAVLAYLTAHPGRLVSHDELLHAVWATTKVHPGVLKVCLRRIRHTLGDSPTQPRFIETVHRQGYRFIAHVTTSAQGSGSFFQPTPDLQPPVPTLVGRETELAHLHAWFETACTGKRQLVFVTGEPGIGKTALVEAFLGRMRNWKLGSGASPLAFLEPKSPFPNAGVWIARGQCLDLHGAGEPYMPVLAALGRLGCEAKEERLIPVLEQYAPTWLVQLPALLSAEARDTLHRQAQGATRERMLREIAEGLAALAAERPLLLVLEDLHWSDPSTLDFLALIARRREPARLLVIGTYRPAEVLASAHPLRTIMPELLGHHQCHELPLAGLNAGAVAQYLAHRFPLQVFPTRLAQALHHRTEGNPLFLVNLVEDLVTHNFLTDGEGGWMVHGEIDRLVAQVPDSSRQLIGVQMARMPSSLQQTLAAASVAGAVFSAAAVAAALALPIPTVEKRCEEVVGQQLFLERAGLEAWPDGTTAARYGFRHALYQELWHEQGTVTQRQEWHQRIGLRKELAYTGQAPEIAAELALHFEQGQDTQRAIQYYQYAASTAAQRHAYQEAIAHFTAALSLLSTLPATAARHQQELQLQHSLHWMLGRSKGEAAPEIDSVAARERELLQWSEETPQLFGAVFGLFDFYLVRGELTSVRFFAEYALRLVRRFPEQPLLGAGAMMMGICDFLAGELLAARTALEPGMAVYRQSPTEASLFWETGLGCFLYAALTLWHLGFPDQALHCAAETITRARLCGARFVEAWGLNYLAWVQILRGDVAAVRTHATAALQLSEAHDFASMREIGRIYQGWALSMQEDAHQGIVQIQQGTIDVRSTSGITFRTYYLALLAEACGKAGRIEEGLSVLADARALVDKTGERYYEADLHRLKGELTLKQSPVHRSQSPVINPQSLAPNPQGEAESCFLQAIAIAREQQAKSLELRAVMSLVRLRQQQALTQRVKRQEQRAGSAEQRARSMEQRAGSTEQRARIRLHEAYDMLSEIYNWFTEGFDTKDLQEAKALLAALDA